MQCLNMYTYKEAHCIYITVMRGLLFITQIICMYAYESVIVLTTSHVNNDKYAHQPLLAIHSIPACVSLIIFIRGYHNNITYYMQKHQILSIYREFHDRSAVKVIMHLAVCWFHCNLNYFHNLKGFYSKLWMTQIWIIFSLVDIHV